MLYKQKGIIAKEELLLMAKALGHTEVTSARLTDNGDIEVEFISDTGFGGHRESSGYGEAPKIELHSLMARP